MTKSDLKPKRSGPRQAMIAELRDVSDASLPLQFARATFYNSAGRTDERLGPNLDDLTPSLAHHAREGWHAVGTWIRDEKCTWLEVLLQRAARPSNVMRVENET